MAATFDVNIVSATDRMRLDIGDTDVTAALWQDETYTGMLARYDGSEDRATLAIAEASLIRFAQQPDSVEVTGAVKVAWKSRLAAWRDLANSLRLALGLPPTGAADTTMRVATLARGGAAASEFGG